MPTLNRVTPGQNDQDARSSRLIQPTSKIRGKVTNSSGAALAGVRVILSRAGFQQQTTTNNAGFYQFRNLASGGYSLRFLMGGTSLVRNVVVGHNGSATVSVEFGPSPTPSPSPRPSPSPTGVPTPSPSPRPSASVSPSPRPTTLPSPGPSVAPTVAPSPGASPSPVFSPSPSPSPEPSPGPIGTDLEAAIRNEEQKLRDSKIVFNPPAEMQEQKTEIIQARISFTDIGAALPEGLQGPGKPQEAPLKVSEIMKVTLTGDRNAFLIQAIGDEKQVVAGKPYAQWEWHVTPLQSGDQKLTLTATAIISLPERGEASIHYKTLEKPIIVHVDRWYTSSQFIANNWQWLWAVVIVPAAGLLWGLKKRKRPKAD